MAGALKLKSAASIVTLGRLVAFAGFVVVEPPPFASELLLLPQAASSATAPTTAMARQGVVRLVLVIGSLPRNVGCRRAGAHDTVWSTPRSNLANDPDHRAAPHPCV